MATIKAVLFKEKKVDGTYPIAIRITKNRKSSYLWLDYSISEKDWDVTNRKVRKSHPNSARLNNLVASKLAAASNVALQLETDDKPATSKAVKQKIKPVGGATFFPQAELYLENLYKAGNYNCYNPDKSRIKQFKEFLDGSDIAFSEITYALLEKFRSYLRSKQLSERSIVNHMLVIRTVYNKAVKSGVADKKNYPFGKDGIVIKFPDSMKIGASATDVKKIEELDLSDFPKEHHARNVWLLSFYFAGMRAGDVFSLKRADFQNGRLYYRMNKNDKTLSLKIPEKAKPIIEYYTSLQCKHGLLFPDLTPVENMDDQYQVQRITSYAIKNTNKYLSRLAAMAKITIDISMHISRHAFGNISGKKIPLTVLQVLYRHEEITTTAIYQQNFINDETDQALDNVINL